VSALHCRSLLALQAFEGQVKGANKKSLTVEEVNKRLDDIASPKVALPAAGVVYTHRADGCIWRSLIAS
jgi:hypothetical protein